MRALLVCLLPTLALAEEPSVVVRVTASDWQLQTCTGEPADVAALPDCFRFRHAATGALLTVEYSTPARATVAGITGGKRAVYRRSSTGRRGVKVGDLTVGLPAAPLAYACDPADCVDTAYCRITDPEVVGVLAGGYVTGCGTAP